MGQDRDVDLDVIASRAENHASVIRLYPDISKERRTVVAPLRGMRRAFFIQVLVLAMTQACERVTPVSSAAFVTKRLTPAPDDCPLSIGELLRTRTDGYTQTIPQSSRSVSIANDLVALAEYSGSWAEHLLVILWLRKDFTDFITVFCAYKTDYGDFYGDVDFQSSLHTHGDRICFDLKVARGDGSGAVEK